MSHSTHVGFNRPPAAVTRGSEPCELGGRAAPRQDRASLASGVGQRAAASFRFRHDPDAIAEVRGTNGSRGNAVPFPQVPERGQITNDVLDKCPVPSSGVSVSVGSQKSWDILHEDVARSKIANGTGELGPEPALVGSAKTLSGG